MEIFVEYSIVYRKLKCSRTFIYKIDSIGIKCIGMNEFRDCTSTEKEVFEQYQEEIKKIHMMSYTPDKRDVKKLVELFDEILLMVDSIYDERKSKKCLGQIDEFLSYLTEEELNSLYNQHEDYIEAWDYKDGAFYRHSKENKKGE